MSGLITKADIKFGDVSLPPYRPDALCPKCSHEVISTFHVEGKDCGRDGCSSCPIEQLTRTCLRCKFQWPEAVLA